MTANPPFDAGGQTKKDYIDQRAFALSGQTWRYPHIYFVDLRFPFRQTALGAIEKPDYDTTNVGLLFPQNDATEVVYLIAQLPHGYRSGSAICAHVHWQQSQSAFPTWTLQYKVVENGSAVPGSFTTLTSNTGVYTYSSGNLAQISEFADFNGPSGLSGFILMKFYRNDNTVAADVLAFELDLHIQLDAPGSGQEYTK